ncbi:MAG: 3-dehydroquinate synthase, partial [Bacillota bacterium]
EAVAIGMAAEARIAEALGVFPEEEATRLEMLISRTGLPVEVPPDLLSRTAAGKEKEFFALMQRDKKALAGKFAFALPVQSGRAKVFRDVPKEVIKQVAAKKLFLI